LSSEKLAERIGEILYMKKGEKIEIYDLREATDITDFFVVCSGESEIHTRALCDAVLEELEREGIREHHVEGYEHAHWILIDYIDVIVHIFLPPEREYYDFERIWGDVPKRRLDDKGEGEEEN